MVAEKHPESSHIDDRHNVLVLGKRLSSYPRNAALIKAFELNGPLVQIELPDTGSAIAAVREVWRARKSGYRAIVFVQPATRFASAILFARILTRATVVVDLFITLYDGYVEDRRLASRYSIKAIFYRACDLLAAHAANILFVDTEEHWEYFRRTLLLGKKSIAVVPVVIDTEQIARTKPIAIPAFDDVANVFRVFFIGTYIPLQGTEYIIRAAKILEKHPQIRFIMLGGGQERARVEGLAKELGLANVAFLPRADYATCLGMLKTADLALGIFGGTEKAMRVVPNKVLEALAAGAPVLTGRNSALARYFEDGVHVRYCEMANPESLADAILRAFRFRDQLTNEAKMGREVISRLFSIEAIRHILGNTIPKSGGVIFEPKKARVNFLAPKIGLSGGTRIFLGYAHRLALRGHDVRVYVKDASLIRRSISNALNVGVPRWLGDFSARIIRVSDFSERSILDADALFVTTAKVALEASRLPESKGRLYYLIQHDEGLYHGDPDIVTRAYTLPSVRLAVSTWVKDRLRERYGVSAELLLNPFDKTLFHHIDVPRQDTEIRVLLLEHPFEWKGTAEGYAIAKNVQARHPKVKIYGFGSRSTASPGRRYDSYVHDPEQSSLARLYSGVDIYLCPSWDEGFGLPSLEAMACGAVVVTYNNGGSGDFALHEQTALVAPRRDVAALERELERAVSDQKLRRTLSKYGEALAISLPSWDARVDQLEAVIARSSH